MPNFAPVRTQGRSRAASIAAEAQKHLLAAGNRLVSDTRIAKSWGIRKHERVGAMFDASTGVAIALGDVLALPKPLARAILLGCLAALDGADGDAGADPTIRAALDRIGIEVGEALRHYLNDRADGRIDEPAAHAQRLLAIAEPALRGWRLLTGVLP